MSTVERHRATWWSGTEELRRPQGLCLPPTRPPVSVPRYLVPAGTACRVSKLTPLLWRNHVTRSDVGFERHESYRNGWYTFRCDGYLVRAYCGNVVHREDGHGRLLP